MRRLALAASMLVFTGCAASRAEVEAPEPELASWILKTEAQPRTDTLTPEDVSASVLFALKQPAHVNVGEVMLWPTDQASTTLVHRRSN